jgi:hypothetical protein
MLISFVLILITSVLLFFNRNKLRGSYNKHLGLSLLLAVPLGIHVLGHDLVLLAVPMGVYFTRFGSSTRAIIMILISELLSILLLLQMVVDSIPSVPGLLFILMFSCFYIRDIYLLPRGRSADHT